MRKAEMPVGFQAFHSVEHIGDVLAEVAQTLQAFGGDGGFKALGEGSFERC